MNCRCLEVEEGRSKGIDEVGSGPLTTPQKGWPERHDLRDPARKSTRPRQRSLALVFERGRPAMHRLLSEIKQVRFEKEDICSIDEARDPRMP